MLLGGWGSSRQLVSCYLLVEGAKLTALIIVPGGSEANSSEMAVVIRHGGAMAVVVEGKVIKQDKPCSLCSLLECGQLLFHPLLECFLPITVVGNVSGACSFCLGPCSLCLLACSLC